MSERRTGGGDWRAVRRRWWWIAAAGAALALPALLVGLVADGVTPASGPSLIAKLRTGVDWTAFGRAGGGDATLPEASSGWLVDGFELTGADLYRMNCRSCHGADGRGARSGIPPLVGALAASVPGAPAAEVRVQHRLVEGGRVMPNFSHLIDPEVALLLEHLRSLGGASASSARLSQSAARVGEHVVKANCQVCHDAVAGPERLPADVAVVTLGEMTARYSAAEFVRKVRTGSPENVRDPQRGRMPRIDYLSEAELEAAYVYLVGFPPQAEAR